MTSSNKVKGFAAGVVAAVCYGTNPLGTLELYGDGFNSSSVLIYRYLLAVAMFAVVMLSYGLGRTMQPTSACTFFTLPKLKNAIIKYCVLRS